MVIKTIHLNVSCFEKTSKVIQAHSGVGAVIIDHSVGHSCKGSKRKLQTCLALWFLVMDP